ncbi:NAD-dependent epimerase/dehydratase family protein, partial [Legionella sp.]|uniref:NAD-dependent epimerase/dehydratase family protein n=1 Tax=Legionella sp. TaxID=459 RepID=UPI003C831268
MKIIIGGGTGLIGQVLVPKLITSGHEVTVISRNKEKINTYFENTVNAATWDDLPHLNPDKFGLIINLAGENIAEHRWSSKIKNKLFSSRLETTSRF